MITGKLLLPVIIIEVYQRFLLVTMIFQNGMARQYKQIEPEYQEGMMVVMPF